MKDKQLPPVDVAALEASRLHLMSVHHRDDDSAVTVFIQSEEYLNEFLHYVYQFKARYDESVCQALRAKAGLAAGSARESRRKLGLPE